jgi:hypothetical protein
MIGSREKRVGGRVSGPRAHARSYLWLCGASAVNKIGDSRDEGTTALADALKTNASLQKLILDCEYGGRGGEGSMKERGGEGEFRDRARTHGLTCGCAWHLQSTGLELKAPWPPEANAGFPQCQTLVRVYR